MHSFLTTKALSVAVFTVAVALVAGGTIVSTASAASSLFWCPDQKPDRQYSAKQEPGCLPLAEKKEVPEAEQEGETPTGNKPSRDFKIENMQGDVWTFLSKYRDFLVCCKTDLSQLQQIQEMGDEVGELLRSTQANMSNHSMASRGIMLRELIQPVAKARADLKKLRATLDRIDTSRSSGNRKSSDWERQAIREMEDSIERDFQAPKLSTGPKTGASIGSAPAAGPSIGKTPRTGNTIGAEGVTGQSIGSSSKNSHDIGSSGPAGFGIGATGRAGPSIGESTFNSESSSAVGSSLQRSTVGSNMSDSTVGSSFGGSTVGSSLGESGVGSSFGSSSVGSTIQERGTGPRQ